MKQQPNPKSFVEKVVDTPPGEFSARDLISRAFLRPKLFIFALLIPPIVAVLFSSMIPLEWVASTKILIRYSGSDTALLKDLVPDARLGLSGTTSAALIKSTPVVEKTIINVGIQQADIYKKPLDVVRDKVMGMLKHKPAEEPANKTLTQNELDNLVGGFKLSLESSSKKSSGDKSIEILEKTSLVPESQKLDELISLEVKSFNREKVADMANGLASAFIDEYYRLYSEEAGKQYAYLDTLVQKQEDELKSIEKAGPADLKTKSMNNLGVASTPIRDDALINTMSAQLTLIQSQLSTASQVYAESAPQVVRLKSQVANLQFQLKKQEAIENSKSLLEQLKTRRYQAANIQSIYKNRLIPINIAEPANEPGPSSSRKVVRVATSGMIGLMLGLMLAISLTIVLNVMDSRIHFSRDLEEIVDFPVISQLPTLAKKVKLTDFLAIKGDFDLEQNVVKIITKIGQKTDDGKAKVITVASPSLGDGASFSALTLAMTLAKNKNQRTCLIDANFIDSGLTKAFNLSQKSGLVDALISVADNSTFNAQLNLSILGTGDVSKRSELGYYTDYASALLEDLSARFEYIVVDAGSILRSNEPAIFGLLSDETMIVVSASLSRKGALKAAVLKMQEAGNSIAGIVLNKSKRILPLFLYKNL